MDFVHAFDEAEVRPNRGAFEVGDYRAGGHAYPGIRTAAPSRMVFTLAIPRRSVLHARVMVDAAAALAPQPLRFRVGVSDERTYEPVTDVLLTPGKDAGWAELRADLSAYAGFKWSLFYRPESRRWRIVLSTDAAAGVPAMGVWGAPGIDADTASAREYRERVAALGR